MSGQVGKTNAASNTTKTTNAPAKKAEQKKQAKQPVPVGGNSKAKKTELKEPKKPTPVIKTITPQEVGKVSLGGICDKFNIKMADLLALNPDIKDRSKIKPDQKIKIPYISKEAQAKYDKEYSEYINKVAAQREKEEIEVKKGKANEVIDQAMKNGWGKDFSFAVNYKNGNVVIVFNKPQTLGNVKDYLGIPNGKIREMNSLESKYGKIPKYTDDTRTRETWDALKIKKGDTIEMDPRCMKPKRKQAWYEFWN